MNKNLQIYHISRFIISVVFGGLLYAAGSPVWSAVLIGVLIFALFIWAPHSGRYSVHPEYGMSALRRDEFTQVINDKAARNAFVVSMLAIGAATVYAAIIGASSLSTQIFRLIMFAGAITYFASDLWLRRLHRPSE